MQEFPHRYRVSAHAGTNSNVTLDSEGVESIESAAPAEFGGPGDLWSPESLLVAAVADCFILTFKAIARASKIEWDRIVCNAQGKLDRVERVTRFVSFSLSVEIHVPEGVEAERVTRLLEKAEQNCLITNSLTSSISLQSKVHRSG